MANTCNNAQCYDRNTEFSKEDILMVCKLEDEEQKRRVGDLEGENNKRVLALQMSQMFEDNTRLTWFQRGSTFVVSLLGNMRSTAASKASSLTSSISNKAGDLGHKASVNLQAKAEEAGLLAKEQAQILGAKAQDAAKDMSNIISQKAENAGLAVQDKAQAVSATIAHKAEDASLQTKAAAVNFAHGVQEQGLEAAHNVSSFAQEKAGDAKSFIFEKFSEYTQKLKNAVNLSFYKTIGSFSGRTNLSFAILEQEAERARRMNSPDEAQAIKNAMRVAALIKGLSALYRPASEPNIFFSTRLLEEAERSRRIYEVKCDNDKSGIDNAKAVANLINQKFNNAAPTLFPMAEKKVEHVEAPKAKKPFAAAM